jgi:HD-GYP domain-containing protein (c-di-GMP phosphodiesterase class II)
MRFDEKALQRLNEIGIALSRESKIPPLLEKILIHAKELLEVDGGTIYTVTDHLLHFEITLSDSLGLHVGGTSNIPVPFSDLPLRLPEGGANESLMVAYAVNHKQTIHIRDAYHEEGFDFSGTRRFDENTGYRTRAVLTIPIKDHEERVIAVIQLINPLDGGIFSEEDVQLAESLASQAGVALTNQRLILSLKKLFESLIGVIAEAIDEQSPFTANHSKRVPILAQLLAEAVNKASEGYFKEIHFSKEEIYELKVASFLHDCGKITTPIYLSEKKSKLETVFDRVELIQTRFMALNEKIEKDCLLKKLRWFESHYPKEFEAAHEEFSRLDKKYYEELAQNKEDSDFIVKVNEGREKIDPVAIERLRQIAFQSCGESHTLLTPEELEALSIAEGNLTEKEKEIVKHHVVMTYRMLAKLDFPKELKRVPEIAASHHERVDGRGYPLGLKREEMSIQARILAIADVFEALSAPDRPYRKALPLSEIFQIMQGMVEEGHLDPDLFELFLKQKVYLPYAQKYLDPLQIDLKNYY